VRQYRQGVEVPQINVNLRGVEFVALVGAHDRVCVEGFLHVVAQFGHGGVESAAGVAGSGFWPERGHKFVAGGAVGADGEVDEHLGAVAPAYPQIGSMAVADHLQPGCAIPVPGGTGSIRSTVGVELPGSARW
jgi:hypothetical protein